MRSITQPSVTSVAFDAPSSHGCYLFQRWPVHPSPADPPQRISMPPETSNVAPVV